MPCVVLRTSRFFPEDDDDRTARGTYDGANLKINELLYRRADIEDIVRGAIASLRADEDFRSALARAVGSKGYHAETFTEGPYPV